MSGIAGVLQLDSAPPDRDFAAAMADFLGFRGPDGQDIWVGDSAALVHTLLRTTEEAAMERQPASLDGKVWITADARIDARRDLIRELGIEDSALARPDCELILHAYERWGEACVDHLMGDFAFAIWDCRNRKLFCARDQFGVKPFYYAFRGGVFVFSNTLDCVRAHPAVSDELDDAAIADFLVIGEYIDSEATAFRTIRRLPEAHTLTVSPAQGLSTRQYWSPAENERIRYRRTGDYVEHFSALMEAAVADRLRTGRVEVSMSGGLDSTSLAAFARKVSPGLDLRAHTFGFSHLVPDDERIFAGMAAKALKMESGFLALDDALPYRHGASGQTPEPMNSPFGWRVTEYYRRMASETAVVFTGHGADALFSLSPLTTWASVRAIPPVAFAANMVRYAFDQGTAPRFRLRSTLKHFLGRASEYRVDIPAWLNPDLAQRCAVDDRVTAYSRQCQTGEGPRSLARYSLSGSYWSRLFETQSDAARFGVGIEFRHPYFDLRVVRWLLAIPELPFCMDKWLLRMALRGLLPETVRKRRKSPARADSFDAAFRRHGALASESLPPHPRLAEFVDLNLVPGPAVDATPETVRAGVMPMALNTWLIFQSRNLDSIRRKNNATRNDQDYSIRLQHA